MLTKTKQLRAQILACTTVRQRLDVLHNAYLGETAYLVAAGPSVADFSSKTIRQRFHRGPCIAVKQGYRVLGDLSDFHLWNLYGWEHCNYDQTPIVIWNFSHDQYPDPHAIVDIPLRMAHPGGVNYKDGNLSVTKAFDSCLLENVIERKPGPTIVPTLAFYLAIHLGVSRLITLGVDISGINHFFPEPKSRMTPLHYQGSMEEQRWFYQAAPDWWLWLKQHGVEWLRVRSPASTKLERIPTIEMEEICEA